MPDFLVLLLYYQRNEAAQNSWRQEGMAGMPIEIFASMDCTFLKIGFFTLFLQTFGF